MIKMESPQSDLRKVNECLVVATLKAQTVAEAARHPVGAAVVAVSFHFMRT